jgi:hypothetical protein
MMPSPTVANLSCDQVLNLFGFDRDVPVVILGDLPSDKFDMVSSQRLLLAFHLLLARC